MSRSLKSYRGNLKYVDYKQAEKDCEKLAANILDVYSPKELELFCFIGIPRGGLIVLGMLSYALDLKPSQLQLPCKPNQPVMIVDDIALTGARISKILAGIQSDHIAIANLYSHPELRKAILKTEPNVKKCFTAHDLKDRAKDNNQDQKTYANWRKFIEDKFGDRYWVGQVDLVGFAWSETDYPFWNPVTEKLDDGWRSIPPHKCLKNKYLLGITPCDVIKRDFHLSSAVIMGLFDDIICLFQKNTGEIYSLTGISAEMWSVLVSYGNIKDSVNYLTKQYDIEKSILQKDLEGYVKELLKNNILEKGAE